VNDLPLPSPHVRLSDMWYQNEDETVVESDPFHVYRWEKVGELWAEDQFGSPDGRESSLHRLALILSSLPDQPNPHCWSHLSRAYEFRWNALHRDWTCRRTRDPKPYLLRALGKVKQFWP